jgi:hypothetical protein
MSYLDLTEVDLHAARTEIESPRVKLGVWVLMVYSNTN